MSESSKQPGGFSFEVTAAAEGSLTFKVKVYILQIMTAGSLGRVKRASKGLLDLEEELIGQGQIDFTKKNFELIRQLLFDTAQLLHQNPEKCY